MTQWDPDCQGPCDCPGEERPEQLELPLCPMAPYAAEPVQVMCGAHKLVQHRDRKRPWCEHCGRAADGELIGQPREERERAKREALVLNRHSLSCLICKRYVETGNPDDEPLPLEA